MNYEKLVKIDNEALDIEWVQQPSNMMKATTTTANARLEMDKAADALDLVYAELDKKIRSDPDKYGLDKVTDNSVKNAIIREEEYQDAKAEALNAKYDYEIAKGFVQSMEQKKSALEGLVKLFINSYFAGPSIPRDLSRELLEKKTKEERSKKTNAGVSRKLKRRRQQDE